MPCFTPLPAFRSRCSTGDEYSFKEPSSRSMQGVDRVHYPCGSCIGCVKDHRQSWAMRLTHESYYHDVSCMLTLTYDKHNVPSAEIPYSHFKSFLDGRLRPSLDYRIRYFVAAEYGEKTARPHFHAIIFGHYPDDLVSMSPGKSQLPLFFSRQLTDFWSLGGVTVAPFSPATAGYVAGYVTKKVMIPGVTNANIAKGRDGRRYVVNEAQRTSTPIVDLPEYHKSSTRPGIGHDWLMQFHRDVLRDGFIIYSGNKVAIPRYYRKLLARHWPDEYRAMSMRREEFYSSFNPDRAYERLLVSETITLAGVKNVDRGSF